MKPSIIQLTQLKRLRAEEKASGFVYPGRLVAVAFPQKKEKGSVGTAIPQEPKRKITKISLTQKSKKEKGVKV